jgi:hypothetical protein
VAESAGGGGVHAEGARGLQFGDGNSQLNLFGPVTVRPGDDGGPGERATEPQFRTDLRALVQELAARARRIDLPYLPVDADLTTLDRTVRIVGRVRRPDVRDRPDEAAGDDAPDAQVYATPGERDRRRDEPPRPWPQVAGDAQRVVVLGDAGMGKSWLLRAETARLADLAVAVLDDESRAHAVGTEPVGIGPVGGALVAPIPVRADTLAAAAGATLAQALAGLMVEQGLLPARSADGLRDLVDAGRVVLLVDALDEVPRHATDGQVSPRKRLEDLLRAWVHSCSGTARCVIASRLAGYPGVPVPGAREVELLAFTPEQTRAAIQAWQLGRAGTARLTARLSDPALAGMAKIPLLLAFLCSLTAQLPESASLPSTRASLDEAIVWRLASGGHHGADPGGHAALGDRDRQRVLDALGRVAVAAAQSPRGWLDQIPYRLLTQTLADPGTASVGTDLVDLVERSGSIGNPALGEQAYMFLHRTIAEYLVARHLRVLPSADRIEIVERHRWFDPDWAVVIPLLVGLLGSRPDTAPDAQAVVTRLLSAPGPVAPQRAPGPARARRDGRPRPAPHPRRVRCARQTERLYLGLDAQTRRQVFSRLARLTRQVTRGLAMW